MNYLVKHESAPATNYAPKNYNNNNENVNPKNMPLIINHKSANTTTDSNKKEDFVDYPYHQIKNATHAGSNNVVKIINNANNNNNNNINTPSSSLTDNINNMIDHTQAYPTPKSISSVTTNSNIKPTSTDDHNNNQLKPTSGQIARIHSNGSGTFPHPNPNQNVPSSNLTASSNLSMGSSTVSSTSLPPNTNVTVNPYQNGHKNANHTSNPSAQKTSAASIAVIDVKTPPSINGPVLDKNQRREFTPQLQQPTNIQPNNMNSMQLKHDVDVKYKFTSNVTIGAKESLTTEFSDINNDTEPSRLSKCAKCLRCSIM